MRKIRRLAMLLVMLGMLTGTAWAAEGLHGAYLTGYPDGTIRPEAELTRAQLAVILARLVEGVECAEELVLADLAPTHWAYGAACLVSGLGVMEAEDGKFRPEEAVTGAALAEVFMALATQECAGAKWPLLRAGWMETEVSFAAGNGWVMGFDGRYFNKDAALSRAETAKIFNALLHRTPAGVEDMLIGMPIFTDNRDTAAWYFLAIQEAAVTHTAERTEQGEVWLALG